MGERYYRFSKKPWDLTIISLTTGFLAVGMNLYTISYLHLGFLGWFISDFTRNLVAFLFYAVPVYFKLGLTPLFRLDPEKLRTDLKRSLPMIPYFSSGQILSSGDRIVLDQLNVGIGSIGHYNLANDLTRNFNILSKGYSRGAKPFFFQAFTKNDPEQEQEVLRLCHISQLLFLGICSLAALWIKEIMHLLIRNDYVDAAYPMAAILLMSYSYRPVYMFFVNKMIARKQDHHLWKLTTISGVVNILINLCFVPFFGVIVAPISTFISMMILGFLGYYFKAFDRISLVQNDPIFWLFALIVLSVLIFLGIDLSPQFKGGVSLMIIAVVAYVLYRYRGLIQHLWKE
jgi:O-antigen/teichoic acid export membrane protein